MPAMPRCFAWLRLGRPPRAGSGESQSVHAGARSQIKGAAVRVAPRHVRREFRTANGAQMSPVGRENPYAARPGDEQIAITIDFHSVERLLAWRRRHVEEDGAVLQAAVGGDLIPHHHLLRGVPVGHIEVALVRRERDAVRPGEIPCHEPQLSIREPEYPAETQVLTWIVEGLRQP